MESSKEPSNASKEEENSPSPSKYPSIWSKNTPNLTKHVPIVTSKPTPRRTSSPVISAGVWTTKNKEEPMNDTMESSKEPSNASKEEENSPSPSKYPSIWSKNTPNLTKHVPIVTSKPTPR
eukprot:496767_1